MSRLRSLSGRYGFAASLLLCAAGIAACEEDSKTTPSDCVPNLPIYDIQEGPNAQQQDDIDALTGVKRPTPCITPLGHAVNQPTETETAGTGGSSTGGSGTGGSTMADAGVGGN
jgi:hypothetical protein